MRVVVRSFVAPDRVLLFIPAESTPDTNDLRDWTLRTGSVWIHSTLLVPADQGFAGLRIAAGTLTFAANAQVAREGASIVLTTLGAPAFTLRVQPEVAEAPDGAFDAANIALTLPGSLTVGPGISPQITGGLDVQGFGSDLSFTPDASSPTIAGGFCRFPLTAADAQWTLAGNRSTLAQFAGSATIDFPCWALPMSTLELGEITSAPHGGSLIARVQGALMSTVAGMSGPPFGWMVSTLTVNARCVELDGLQVLPGGRTEIAFWTGARSSFVFHQQPLRQLRFRSERGGIDALAVRGGEQRNLWDLPRGASATPFAFTGTIDTFGLIAGSDGMVVSCAAEATPPADAHGLALENLYLVVRAPRRCALAAALEAGAVQGPTGLGFLWFDARYGIPTLPDPYAANVGVRDPSDTFRELLRTALNWTWAQAPVVRAHLDGPLRLSTFTAVADANDEEVTGEFRARLHISREKMFLLDLSSREHLFGVALDTPGLNDGSPDSVFPSINENRMALPANCVRLFLQPQVHWEPLWVEFNPRVPQLQQGFVHSNLDPGLTLLGSSAVDGRVPTVPDAVTGHLLDAVRNQENVAALFALPFGIRAVAHLGPTNRLEALAPPRVDTTLHEPDFGELHSARQIRVAANSPQPGQPPPSDLTMPGFARQLQNLDRAPAPPAPNSVLGNNTLTFNNAFNSSLPLHRVDLSGYGLTTFSEWNRETDSGISKVHFHALNGRTAYEVIQIRTRLYECTAPVVRTITMARHNGGSVVLTDSGWVPTGDGEFVDQKTKSGQTAPFENGVVRAFRRIRRITTTGETIVIPVSGGIDMARFEKVTFDADADIDRQDGAPPMSVPVLNRVGYVFLPDAGVPLVAEQLQRLFATVRPIASPVDASLMLVKTLGLHATSIAADYAPDAANGPGFAVALVGNPQLPRAAQWSVVKIDAATQAASPIDQHRGVPLVRNGNGAVMFRDPSDTRRPAALQPYGLLMTTPSHRTLFPQPSLDPGQPQRISCEKPLLADPYSLVKTASAFPGAAAALKLKELASFEVNGEAWKIEQGPFTFDPPAKDLMKGAEWALDRVYPGGPIDLGINSLLNKPWKLDAPQANLDLVLPDPLKDILAIKTNYLAGADGLPKMAKPELVFAGALNEIKKIIGALKHFVDTGVDADVNVVAAGSGATPSFIVQLKFSLRIGKPEERIDIGVGKFFGRLLLTGELQLGTSGGSNPRLFLEFQGDIQQGIIPPLLFAGGLFRFGITIPSTGRPIIQLSLGVVASIGGDLIKGLLEVEVTVHYGYTLIPETLQPGVLLGLDARAKLLSGLVGFSFGVEAMGRLQRVDDSGVRIWAHIRVAATVQIAWLIEEDVDFETEFEQKIPMSLVTLVSGANPSPRGRGRRGRIERGLPCRSEHPD